ncbi:MAG: MFS transporter [Pseudomonadota bacterium]
MTRRITARDWLLLTMIGITVGQIALNESAIGLALPSMRQDLGMSQPQSHWAVNAYLLVFAALIAGAGKLGDLIGLKPVFVGGVVIFTLGSVACALAMTGDQIIAARAVQGIGAAAIYPASLAMSSLIFPPEREGQALGLFSAIAAGFLVLGPLVGGLLTQGLSWRWIFWVNVPAVIAIPFVLAGRFDEARKTDKRRFDFIGLALLVVGLGALVIGTMEGPDWGWSSPTTIIALALGVVGLGAFVLVEQRLDQPLIRVGLFGFGAFSYANSAVFLGMSQRMVVAVFGALFLQDVLGYDPIDAGLALLPAMIPVALLATYSGRLADRMDPVVVTKIGMAATGLCLVWTAIAIALESYWVMLPALVLWGATMTLIMAPPRKTIMAIAGREQRGEASGISLATQLLGATTGIAIASAVLSATSSYTIVFAVTAAITLVVCAMGLFVRSAPPG